MKILNEDTKQILVEKWKFNADFGKVVGFGRFSPQSVFSTPLLPFWVHFCLVFLGYWSPFWADSLPGRWTWISPHSLMARTRSPRTSGAFCPNTPPTSCVPGSSSTSWWAHPAWPCTLQSTLQGAAQGKKGCFGSWKEKCPQNLQNEQTEVVVCLSLGYLEAQSGFAFILGAFEACFHCWWRNYDLDV